MVLQKEDIWERLKIRSTFVSNDWTPLFAAAVPEEQFRFVVGIFISGNADVTTGIEFGKVEEGATRDDEGKYSDDEVIDYSGLSPIQVAPADFRQIPKGSYSITDPIITFEGGTDFAGKTELVDAEEKLLNVTVIFWDWDV